MIPRYTKLNNGHEMPTIGLGTAAITEQEKMERTLRTAIGLGYRHIDTASAYGNEGIIGAALKKLIDEDVVRREDIFITSKLWNDQHRDPKAALKQTLERLQTDYLDLYLIHWPVTMEPDEHTHSVSEIGNLRLAEFDPVGLWKKMEELQEAGLTKSIGVANFGVCNIKKILETCKIRPAMDQVECHPYHKQKKLIGFLESENIRMTSYSSLGSGKTSEHDMTKDPVIVDVAGRNKITPSQAILSYLVSKSICIIPKSTSEQHLRENMELVELDSSDIERLDKIDIDFKFTDHPQFGPNRYL
jgi:aldehyde reductase